MMISKRQRSVISCGACVYRFVENNSAEILLVKPFEHNPAWGIPKGHININETFDECAKREVLEETGISISIEEELSPVVAHYRYEDKTVYSFLAQQTSFEPAKPLDGENVDVRWFSIDNLPHLHVYQVSLMNEAVRIIKTKLLPIETTPES